MGASALGAAAAAAQLDGADAPAIRNLQLPPIFVDPWATPQDASLAQDVAESHPRLTTDGERTAQRAARWTRRGYTFAATTPAWLQQAAAMAEPGSVHEDVRPPPLRRTHAVHPGDAPIALNPLFDPGDVSLGLEGFGAGPVQMAIAANFAANRVTFEEAFALRHQGSIDALGATVSALLERDPASIPQGGITRENLEERDWTMTYRLPALVLARALPELCRYAGNLSHLSIFQQAHQKPDPDVPRARYPSLLANIYQQMVDEYGEDAATLEAALPALVQRMSTLVEAEVEPTTPFERQLSQTLLQAAHHIQGDVLAETFKRVWSRLNLPE